ncbi:patatin-like phospholipase family protein [bacterium]|nr:patatin-like phospholipase family protein [bacterium]
MKSIGLALGGGGARGFCHIAFLKILDELGLKPKIISGTSIGAIIGSFYAAGMSAEAMEDMLESIGFIEITKMMDWNILKDSALFKGKGIEEFIEENLPVNSFEACQIPIKIVATDFWHRKQIVFESGDLIEAIRASISLPLIFEPVKHGNQILIDGGAVNPVPYDVIQNQCELCIAIDVSGKREPKNKNLMPNMFDNVLSTFEIMQDSILENKNQINRPNIYIKPDLVNVGVLDFFKFKQIMQSVSQDAADFKTAIEKACFPRKKKFFIFH